nr:hypothetical protein [Tanacetum cinerariifolium]
MLNPTPDAGMESIFETTSQIDVQTPTSVAPFHMSALTLTPSTIATITTTQQAPIPPTTASSTLLQDLPNFSSLFRFDHRLKTLEENFFEFMQMNRRMNEAVKVAVQLQSDRLRDEAQKENDEFLKTIDENMQKIIKEQVKEQVKVQISKILPKIEQTVNEQLEAKVLTRSSNSSKTSYDVAADLSEMELKKILIEKIEGNKSIHQSNEQRNLYKALVEAYESDKIILDTYGDTVTLKTCRDDDADKNEEPFAGSDRGSKRHRKRKEPESTSASKEKATMSAGKSTQWSKYRQTSASESAIAEEPIVEPSQHPEWFSQQKKPPTPDRDWNKTLPATHRSIQLWISELAKQTDSRSSFNELMDTPMDFSNFLMNRLKVDTLTPELLAGPTYELMKGSYKSLVELEFFLEEVYKETTDQLDWESARDVYSKRRIIAVAELKIVEWHNYKHLDWITIRRDDDKVYKFKEGDFKRLHIQDIEDMLLLLVQGKLTNLTVEERFAFNVSLQMFTRSIIIQRRVEDLQLGVESYQKKLNLTKPDTYHSNLKRKEAYIAYSNPRGFIYQNIDKQYRLMRIDELHKFIDGTLTDVRTALDDRLKGIHIKYLPQTICRKSDKERAAAMIQAIDKRLKTRRIMRSLSILTDLQVTPTKPGGMTKPYSSYRFIANCFNAGNLKMEVKERDDIFIGTDDFMPPGIESDDYDSERDIHFLEELPSNDFIFLPENESSNFDHHDDPSFPRPHLEPPDVEIFFEPDSGVLTTNVVKVYDALLLFSLKNEDKVLKPGILSYLLISHRDKTTFDFSENPMMMYGGDIPSNVVLDLYTIPMDK